MDLWGREDEEERTRRLFGIHAGAAEEKHFASHEELAAAIHTCAACHLRQEGNLGPVLSSGPVPAPLMLVGEGPGGVEDDWGAPLIGPSGQLLDKALASVGITRDRVYVTNVVKCRPRGNRTPDIAEGRACADRWLREEIRLVQPKAVVALGKAALRWFLGREDSIVRRRGRWLEWEGIPVMPTYHPAYLLRQYGRDLVESKWQVYYDLKEAKEKAASAAPDWVWKTDPPPDLMALFAGEREKRHQK